MNTYVSGDFAVATAVGMPRFSQPFPGVNVSYVLKQDYMQFIGDFTPLALDTPHDDYGDFVLVEESELQDVGNGIGKWVRTYAKVPESYNEMQGTYAYNFIGFFGIFGIVSEPITGRDRFTKTVPVRVQRDFYNTDAPWDIDVIPAQTYFFDVINQEVDFLADSPPFSLPTVPSRTEYEDMIEAEDEIVVEASRISRWLGNIWMRETMYVKAL